MGCQGLVGAGLGPVVYLVNKNFNAKSSSSAPRALWTFTITIYRAFLHYLLFSHKHLGQQKFFYCLTGTAKIRNDFLLGLHFVNYGCIGKIALVFKHAHAVNKCS